MDIRLLCTHKSAAHMKGVDEGSQDTDSLDHGNMATVLLTYLLWLPVASKTKFIHIVWHKSSFGWALSELLASFSEISSSDLP
jgi:hypothetical protein